VNAGERKQGTSNIKSYAAKRWQSDIIVDLIKHYGFPYIALNPGASYRGLHDSLVNYGGDDPPMLLCQHEKIAVQIAHGYAKVTGKPMIAIVHDVVGLLHATMGIYYAYIDRAPVFVIGATGPMDESKRRPFIDWIHTANVQGEQVRNYVKWDYQPGSIEGVPDSFARAYATMMTEPQGPVHIAMMPGCKNSCSRNPSRCRNRTTPRCRHQWRPNTRRWSRLPIDCCQRNFQS
jgi:acetolactate synthase I/II/III large subunit